MDILLSIIVSAYNVSDYLDDCMKSIVEKYEDIIEILVVDDGSTDDSGKIADGYANRYGNVTTYHKHNGGLSDARNYGLLHAKGKYVFFLDSDDMVSDEYFQQIVEHLISFQGEVLLWDAELVDESGRHLKSLAENYYTHAGADTESLCSGERLIDQQLRDHGDFVTTVWLGAYSRKMLLDNQLWFEKGLIHEDELWTPRVLLQSDKVLYMPLQFYQYRIRSNSIMTGGKKDRSKNLASIAYAFSTLYAYYDWKIENQQFRRCIKANLTKRYLHKISQYNAYHYPEIAKRIPKFTILNTAKGFKDKCRAFVLMLSGKLYCFLTKNVRE